MTRNLKNFLGFKKKHFFWFWSQNSRNFEAAESNKIFFLLGIQAELERKAFGFRPVRLVRLLWRGGFQTGRMSEYDTYTNEQFKFSIDYPKGWVVENAPLDMTEPGSTTVSSQIRVVAVHSNVTNQVEAETMYEELMVMRQVWFCFKCFERIFFCGYFGQTK